MLEQLRQEHPDTLRVVYRHFPLESIHDKAALGAQAAEAAGLQGKFWEMHDLLFAKQDAWASMTPEQFQGWLAEQAGSLGLDVERFKTDLTSDAMVKIATDAWDNGKAIGLPGTPFLVLNGSPYGGPVSFGSLDAIIKLNELEDRQFPACPPMTIDPAKKYTATIKTEKGDLQIELYPDKAPLAVNNFVFLARNGWYDGVTFHRVIPGFVAQAGDPTGTGAGGPGYSFINEVSPDLKFDGPGVVAMANAGVDTNGSQFFITYDAAPHLDGGYTIFGHLIAGMDVLQKLTPRDPSPQTVLPPGDKILSVTIEER